MADDEAKKAKQAEMEMKRAEVRKRMEEASKAKKAKKGFMTPERKKKLRLLLRKKAAEELKREQERKAAERRKVIEERCGTMSDLENSSEDDLKEITKQYFERMYLCESQKWDLEHEVRKRDYEITDLNSQVNDLRGKFIKPTLKKVSKYENKFAKLQKKAAEFNFRNQLKTVKKKEFTLEEEDKEKKGIVDWSKKDEKKGEEDEEEEEETEEGVTETEASRAGSPEMSSIAQDETAPPSVEEMAQPTPPPETPPPPPSPPKTEEDIWLFLREAVTSANPLSIDELKKKLIESAESIPQTYLEPVVVASIKRSQSQDQLSQVESLPDDAPKEGEAAAAPKVEGEGGEVKPAEGEAPTPAPAGDGTTPAPEATAEGAAPQSAEGAPVADSAPAAESASALPAGESQPAEAPAPSPAEAPAGEAPPTPESAPAPAEPAPTEVVPPPTVQGESLPISEETLKSSNSNHSGNLIEYIMTYLKDSVRDKQFASHSEFRIYLVAAINDLSINLREKLPEINNKQLDTKILDLQLPFFDSNLSKIGVNQHPGDNQLSSNSKNRKGISSSSENNYEREIMKDNSDVLTNSTDIQFSRNDTDDSQCSDDSNTHKSLIFESPRIQGTLEIINSSNETSNHTNRQEFGKGYLDKTDKEEYQHIPSVSNVQNFVGTGLNETLKQDSHSLRVGSGGETMGSIDKHAKHFNKERKDNIHGKMFATEKREAEFQKTISIADSYIFADESSVPSHEDIGGDESLDLNAIDSPQHGNQNEVSATGDRLRSEFDNIGINVAPSNVQTISGSKHLESQKFNSPNLPLDNDKILKHTDNIKMGRGNDKMLIQEKREAEFQKTISIADCSIFADESDYASELPQSDDECLNPNKIDGLNDEKELSARSEAFGPNFREDRSLRCTKEENVMELAMAFEGYTVNPIHFLNSNELVMVIEDESSDINLPSGEEWENRRTYQYMDNPSMESLISDKTTYRTDRSLSLPVVRYDYRTLDSFEETSSCPADDLNMEHLDQLTEVEEVLEEAASGSKSIDLKIQIESSGAIPEYYKLDETEYEFGDKCSEGNVINDFSLLEVPRMASSFSSFDKVSTTCVEDAIEKELCLGEDDFVGNERRTPSPALGGQNLKYKVVESSPHKNFVRENRLGQRSSYEERINVSENKNDVNFTYNYQINLSSRESSPETENRSNSHVVNNNDTQILLAANEENNRPVQIWQDFDSDEDSNLSSLPEIFHESNIEYTSQISIRTLSETDSIRCDTPLPFLHEFHYSDDVELNDNRIVRPVPLNPRPSLVITEILNEIPQHILREVRTVLEGERNANILSQDRIDCQESPSPAMFTSPDIKMSLNSEAKIFNDSSEINSKSPKNTLDHQSNGQKDSTVSKDDSTDSVQSNNSSNHSSFQIPISFIRRSTRSSLDYIGEHLTNLEDNETSLLLLLLCVWATIHGWRINLQI